MLDVRVDASVFVQLLFRASRLTNIPLDPGGQRWFVGIRFRAGQGELDEANPLTRFRYNDHYIPANSGRPRRQRSGKRRRKKWQSVRVADKKMAEALQPEAKYDAGAWGIWCDRLRSCWKPLWAHASRRILRHDKATAKIRTRAAHDKLAAEICTPLPGDHSVLVVIGDGFVKSHGFSHVRARKGGYQPPTCEFVQHLTEFTLGGVPGQRGKPIEEQEGQLVVGRSSEHRTSACTEQGERADHPRDNIHKPWRCSLRKRAARQSNRVDPASKRSTRVPDVRIQPHCDKVAGAPADHCRCWCAECGNNKCTRGRHCDACFAQIKPRNTSLVLSTTRDDLGQPKTRIAGRDAAAAENIARLLFAALLGVPDHRRGMWSKRAYDLQCIGAHYRAPLYYNIDYVNNAPPSCTKIYNDEAGCEPSFTIKPVEPARFN